MQREAFEIFGITVYWYGVFFAGGFFAAVVHWTLLGRREKHPPELASDLALWLMIGGVIGARAAYVIANWSEFQSNPAAILQIWNGGLIYYGGLIGGTLLTIFMLRRRGLKLAPMGDFIFTALPLGHAFGRTGCHLNGCCHGAPTDFFWAVPFDGQLVHPTQLLEVGFNLLLYVGLLYLYRRNKIPGRVMATYLLTYPVFRFLIEYLRGDDRASMGPFDAAQYISMILFGIGITLWIKCRTPREA